MLYTKILSHADIIRLQKAELKAEKHVIDISTSKNKKNLKVIHTGKKDEKVLNRLFLNKK